MFKNLFITLPIYHVLIIGFYFCVYTYVFLTINQPFSYYSLQSDELSFFAIITLISFISLYVLQKFLHLGTLGINKVSVTQFAFITFYATVLIAIPEEILFRGYTHHFLKSLSVSPSVIVLISSTVFGMVHILNEARSFHPKNWNWKLVTLSFVAGLYLGLLYEQTKSLLLPTILHALFVITLKVFIKRKNLLQIG